MTPEGKVKQWLRKTMKERYPESFHYAPPGGRFGKAGMPDDVWLIPACMDICVFVGIESKVDDNKPTGLQMKTLKDIKRCGGIAAVMTNKDTHKLEAICNEINRRIHLANEKSCTSALRTSEGDDNISDTQ